MKSYTKLCCACRRSKGHYWVDNIVNAQFEETESNFENTV